METKEIHNNGFEDIDELKDAIEKNSIEGAFAKIEDFKRDDGIIVKSLENSNRNQNGILARAMTAIQKDSEYRQELKTATFRTRREAVAAVNAINEKLICGLSIRPNIDKIIALSAGENGYRLDTLLHTYSNSNVSITDYSKYKKGANADRAKNANSPLE